MTEEHRHGGSFFGRRKGRPLRSGQQQAIAALLPRLRLDPSQSPPQSLSEIFAHPTDSVRLEIGFGGGEHLLHAARAQPNVGFIGVEPFESGLAKAVTSIAHEGIENIRLYDQDAALILDWLPANSLARIDLLYPDPWPKKRHWKRRFVSQANLGRIRRCLEPGGEFRFATDVDDYAQWARDQAAQHGVLSVERDSAEPWEGWPGTRYEAKAAKAGRAARYLILRSPPP